MSRASWRRRPPTTGRSCTIPDGNTMTDLSSDTFPKPNGDAAPAVSASPANTAGQRPRQTAYDFHPEVLRLFDACVHGSIDRRSFLDRAAKFAAAGVTAAGLLDA